MNYINAYFQKQWCYIKKPFKGDELIATVEKFFEGKDTSMVLNTFEKHIEKREEFKKKG